MDRRRRAFVEKHTSLQRPPQTPELQLYLADEMMPLWAAIEQQWGKVSGPPFWAFAWAGGLALARYLLDSPEEVAGKRVVDFATGSGLCAIAAMKCGASHVLGADVDPFSLEAGAMNAEVNEVGVEFASRNLLLADPPDVDLILAGDVCYEEPFAKRVVEWLRAAHKHGTRILLGDPFRAHLPEKGLAQLREYEVQTTRELEDAEIKRAGVFTFMDT